MHSDLRPRVDDLGLAGRRLVRAAAAAVMFAAASTLLPAPAQALSGWPDAPCNAGTGQYTLHMVDSAFVDPTITHFLAINVAPGTSMQRNETLNVMRSVSVTVGMSTEITASGTVKLIAVSGKVGFSVQVSAAS